MPQKFRLQRGHLAALPFALGLLCLTGAAALPWWHVFESPQPPLVRGAHLVLGCAVLLGLGAIRFVQVRARLLICGAMIALLLAVWMIVHLALGDMRSINAAVSQTTEADRLVRSISRTDVTSYVAWLDSRQVLAPLLLRNDYTVVDAVESVIFFARVGWYLLIVGGLAWVLAAFLTAPLQARQQLLRLRWLLVSLAVLSVAVYGVRPYIGYNILSQGRIAHSSGNYLTALEYYKRAAKWDATLNDDVVYHFELGMIYGKLDRDDHPDYLACLADQYVRSGREKKAYMIYRYRLAPPFANSTIAIRYANMMLRAGTSDLLRNRPSSAVEKWEQALRADPDNIQILHTLAIGYAASGDYPNAIAAWKRVIRMNESVGLFRNKYVVALTFRKVITARAWGGLAWCYYRQQRFDLALQCNENASSLGGHPTDIDGRDF